MTSKEAASQDWTAKRAMGRSKLYNNKEAKQLVAAPVVLSMPSISQPPLLHDAPVPAFTPGVWMHPPSLHEIRPVLVAPA